MAYDILQLNDFLLPELLEIANTMGIKNAQKLEKDALIYQILDQQALTKKNDIAAAEPVLKKTRVRKPTPEAPSAEPKKVVESPISNSEAPVAPTTCSRKTQTYSAQKTNCTCASCINASRSQWKYSYTHS